MLHVTQIIILINLISFHPMQPKESLIYEVTKLNAPLQVDADWNKAPWESIIPLSLDNYMGDQPEHFPEVEAKVAYDNAAIYVIFRAQDQYVRAKHIKHQEGVYEDSCVEFFFSPANDSQNGYFNLEMNCGGTMLFHHQAANRENKILISKEDIAKIEVAHSLPKKVDPEIQEPTTWTVEYRIPFEILSAYHTMDPPTSGAVWRSNFYKCADKTSHPHWLTWSPIDYPRPNFHLPAFFGTLKFM